MCAWGSAVQHEQWMYLGMQRHTHIVLVIVERISVRLEIGSILTIYLYTYVYNSLRVYMLHINPSKVYFE